MNAPISAEAPHYWCFISYRHADNREQDRSWASWLHREIERYEVPAEMVGQPNSRGDLIPERIYPIFRDEESLPADSDLAHSIVLALALALYGRALLTEGRPEQVCGRRDYSLQEQGLG
jgi:hypothetical protein